MIGKRLLSLLQGTVPSIIDQANSTLSRGDREAIVADFGHADAVEPGLGDALARYVITGEGEAVLLRLEALLQPGGKLTALKEALLPSGHAWGNNKAEKEQRLVSRVRTLFGMQGFDAAAVQRYGQVFARLQQQRTYYHNVPGSDRSPMWLRELLDLLGAYRRANRANAGSVGVLTVPHLLAVLALDRLPVGTIIDCLFTGRGDLGQHTRLYLETPELAEALAADAASATEAVRALGAVGRATMLGYFQRTGLLGRDQPFIDLAFALAADGAKAVRDAAVAALATAPEGRIGAMANDRLASRDTDARLAAVNVLVARLGTGALPRLAEHEAVETSKKIVQAITMAKATLAAVAGVPAPAEDGAGSYGAVDGSTVTAPPWVPALDTVADDVAAVFHTLVAAANAAAKLDFAAVPVEALPGHVGRIVARPAGAGLTGAPELQILRTACFRRAIDLMPSLADVAPDRAGQAASALADLHHALETATDGTLDRALFDEGVAALLAGTLLPVVAGAVSTLAFLAARLAAADLTACICGALAGAAADPADRAAPLAGLMAVQPALLRRCEAVLTGLDDAFEHMAEEAFIAVLPHLRLALSVLDPHETDDLAERVATLRGLAAPLTLPAGDLPEAEMLANAARALALSRLLAEDGLADWAAA